MGLFDVDTSAKGIFSLSAPDDAQREGVAKRGLLVALDLFREKRYDEAISKFKQAIAFAPRSETAINAYDYIARSYLSKGDAASAIEAYKKSLNIDPQRVETLIALGNAYYTAERPEDARTQYEAAVRLDPSAPNRYSLGQAYLQTGQYDLAEIQFKEVTRLAPGKPNGDFGLGQTYAKQGLLEKAVDAFQVAISKQPDYWEAYAEMGYALVDRGELEQAQNIAIDLALQPEADALAVTLSAYILQKTAPKMMAAYSTSTFLKSLGPGTPVASLGAGLVAAGGSQMLTMVFQFDLEMDRRSVENVLNWNISRSVNTGKADGYNFDFAVPETEVLLPNTPVSVSYDAALRTATVYFNVYQNGTADGTIDPSHIKFSFNGVGTNGAIIDSAANDYTGFSEFT